MKKFLKIIRYIAVSLVAVIFISLGVDATDNFNHLSESIIGRILAPKSGPCPDDMVLIPSDQNNFCIDIYEASPGQACSVVNPQNQTETRDNLDQVDCQPVSQKNKLPWRNISYDQASRACAKAGKRLPTNAEWLQASLGTPDSESVWTAKDCQVNYNWDEQPGLSGSGKNCISSFGAYDMIGNVWEWVKGTVKQGEFNNEQLPNSGFIDATDGEGIPIMTNNKTPNANYNNDYYWLKSSDVRGMARGGYWRNKSDAGVYSLYIVTPPFQAEAGIGFRCVK